jgi:hypothetical protein
LHGDGVYTYQDGRKLIVTYVDGKCIKRTTGHSNAVSPNAAAPSRTTNPAAEAHTEGLAKSVDGMRHNQAAAARSVSPLGSAQWNQVKHQWGHDGTAQAHVI